MNLIYYYYYLIKIKIFIIIIICCATLGNIQSHVNVHVYSFIILFSLKIESAPKTLLNPNIYKYTCKTLTKT